MSKSRDHEKTDLPEQNKETASHEPFASGILKSLSGKGDTEKESLPHTGFAGSVILWGLLAAAALVVIFAGIKAAQTIVGPFCLAAFLAIILTAPLRWLKSRGIPDLLAAFVIIAGVLIGGLSITWILSGSVNQFIARIPEYTLKFNKTIEDIDDFLEPHGLSLLGGPPKLVHRPSSSLMNLFGMADEKEDESQNDSETPPDEHPETADAPVSRSDSQDTAEQTAIEKKTDFPGDQESGSTGMIFPELLDVEKQGEEALANSYNTVGIVGYLRWGAAELGKLATICFIVMILVVFMMYEASRLPKKILGAFGTQGITNEHIQNVVDKVWKYMYIKTIISLCVGVCVWILLVVMQVEYAMLWALLAFFLNYIPNIGSIIAAVPGIALAQFDHGLPACIIVTIGYLLINQGFGYYVEPIFLGDGLGISPLVVLLSLIFWGWLLGLIGMFLSAPLTIVAKIILDSFDETRWASILMDDK